MGWRKLKEIYQDEFNKLYDVYWDLYPQHF